MFARRFCVFAEVISIRILIGVHMFDLSRFNVRVIVSKLEL